ncbi:hypothetical protein TSAR_007736 [Trichomalopsis sarcophagae]|uniref:Uncharacterized protein n=1 Tax=Trichomalopsis sarcophagae TaxID=543379 RepID=A0A232EJQ2_9HYME|nr:hypothetical protein TSAR_007736 [Trichomalopsis sarcophagae]
MEGRRNKGGKDTEIKTIWWNIAGIGKMTNRNMGRSEKQQDMRKQIKRIRSQDQSGKEISPQREGQEEG